MLPYAPAPRQAVWWLLKPEEMEPNQKEYVSEFSCGIADVGAPKSERDL
jgi:hypothetical protein